MITESSQVQIASMMFHIYNDVVYSKTIDLFQDISIATDSNIGPLQKVAKITGRRY